MLVVKIVIVIIITEIAKEESAQWRWCFLGIRGVGGLKEASQRRRVTPGLCPGG